VGVQELAKNEYGNELISTKQFFADKILKFEGKVISLPH
jgi:hypothetical protein